ncbi:hypothetical protein SNE40_018484 [Patella caerulea]|uniref:Sialate O-acetylesterase domain-containing protein n=2 Tax=Patella caerulea TaxID=87958 RepID=A0AAN8J536_PATCE
MSVLCKGFLLLVLFTTKLEALDSKFAFASYYGDHMVLQRGPQRANVWGYASEINATVTVSITGVGQYQTSVVKGPFLDRGVWRIMLPAVFQGGPYVLTAELVDGSSITIKDILFGDVWVCSGQSNMEFTLTHEFNASVEFAEAINYQNIRLFTVNHSESGYQQFEFSSVEERWSLPNNKTLANTGSPAQWLYFSAVCWLYGKHLYEKLGYPIGLIASTWGGTMVESWSDDESLAQCGLKPPPRNRTYVGFPKYPALLWNSMVHPLVNYTIYGVIWYQGEANAAPTGTPAMMNRYNCTFPAMIDGWRRQFHEGSNGETDVLFPFGFVQLAPWHNNATITVGFPDIRWHQTADYGYVPNKRMKNVFMAVALDLPDYTSPFTGIHPRDKEDVGKRLALAGLGVAYNHIDNRYTGPYPIHFQIFVAQNTTQITYDDQHLDIRSKDGFEICCLDQTTHINCADDKAKWYPAPINASDNSSVTIGYGGVCGSALVSSIRYAWRESPCPFKACAVYTRLNDLPAPPFIEVLLSPSAFVYH